MPCDDRLGRMCARVAAVATTTLLLLTLNIKCIGACTTSAGRSSADIAIEIHFIHLRNDRIDKEYSCIIKGSKKNSIERAEDRIYIIVLGCLWGMQHRLLTIVSRQLNERSYSI